MFSTKTFLEDLAKHLSKTADSTSPFTWRSTGTYSASEFGIYAMVAPAARNRSGDLVIRVYDSMSDPTLSDSTLAVQLDFYGPAQAILDATDYVFDRLHGSWGVKLGVVRVISGTRTSGAPWGQDEGGNLRQTENYELAVHKPSTNRQ